jgi:YVTN family beta-propeller protein
MKLVVYLFFILLATLALIPNVYASSVIQSVAVGVRPIDIVVTPTGDKIYVTNSSDNSVSVIDTNSFAVVKTITLLPSGGSASWMAISPGGDEVYVAERLSAKIQVISTVTDSVVDTIDTVSGLLNKIAVTPDGSRLYAPSANVSGIIRMSVIDLSTRSVVDYLDTVDAQDAIDFGSNSQTGYLQLEVNNSVPLNLYTNVVDLNTKLVLSTIHGTALRNVSDSGLVAWGINYGDNTVNRIDLLSNLVTNSAPVPARPNETVVDEPSNRLFVTSDNSNSITILNLQTLATLETIAVNGNSPAGLTMSPDGNLLYVVNIDSNTIDVVQLDEVDPVVDEEGINDLLEKLIMDVKIAGFAKSVEQSYLAHLEKLIGMLDSANKNAVRNQLEAFIKKLADDVKKGVVTPAVALSLEDKANAIIEVLMEFEFEAPLITQVVSPHPSIAETSVWAPATYAGGRASTTGSCGLTIKQCGCAISSLSMLGKYYGINAGYDGTNMDPLNMNDWLLANNGYSNGGDLLWNFALAYMGERVGDKVMTRLSLASVDTGVTDRSKIIDSITQSKPVLGFNDSKKHWMLLRGTTADGYYVNDPFWYNTKTTDDTKDAALNVQDYNDVITKANLFEHSVALHDIHESVELVLESPAELLITDSKGRRLGFDPVTHTYVSEIPGGSYDREDFILDQENPSPNPHKAKRLMLIKPEGEVFDLKVIGTGSGEYNLATAITDGKGGLFGERASSTTSVGQIDAFTVTTSIDTNDLPPYLKEILVQIPVNHQKKFVQAFKVIVGQTEKDHVVSTTHIIEGLIKYTKEQFEGTSWADGVVQALTALIP